jgi:hypothetical protein
LALPWSTTRGTIGAGALPPRARSAQIGNRLAARLPFAAVAGGGPVTPGFTARTIALGPRTPHTLAALLATLRAAATFSRTFTGLGIPAPAGTARTILPRQRETDKIHLARGQ